MTNRGINKARKIAIATLEEIRYKVPVDVKKILRSKGIRLLEEKLETDVSGMLVLQDDGTPVVVINSTHPDPRKRFTMAHELGHYLLHSQSCSIFIDARPMVFRRDQTSSLGTHLDEIEANSFAAELLMPERVLRTDVLIQSIDVLNEGALKELADRYEVSAEALTFRLTKLGLLRG